MGSVEVIDLSSDDESEKVRGIVPVKLEPGAVKQEHRRQAKCGKSQSRATGKDVEENFSGSVPSTGHSNSSVLEQGPSPIDDTGISYASPLCAAPLSRQFWKAGSYDEGHASQIGVKGIHTYVHVYVKLIEFTIWFSGCNFIAQSFVNRFFFPFDFCIGF